MSTTPWPIDSTPANQHHITDAELTSIEFGGHVLLAYGKDRGRGSVAAGELLAIVERCRPATVPESAARAADALSGDSVAVSVGVA